MLASRPRSNSTLPATQPARKPPAEPERTAPPAESEPDAAEDESTKERSPIVALTALDDDVCRHMLAWEWRELQFVEALEGWAGRARMYFETKRKRADNVDVQVAGGP